MIMYFAMNVFPGILKDKTIADKLMYFRNDDTQNYPFQISGWYVCTLNFKN